MTSLTQFRLDEESLLFTQRQLTAIAAKVYERDYSKQFKMANGEILPIDILSQYAAKKNIELVEYDPYGMAEVIADYSKGGPRVGVVARRHIYPIRTIGDHAAWSWEEVLLARGEGLPLEEKNLGATRIAIEAYLNKLGFIGDPQYNLPGILTSNLARMVSATTFAASSTDVGLEALVTGPLDALSEMTNGFVIPSRIVLPERQFRKLANTRIPNTKTSVLTAFKENQQMQGRSIEVISDNNLKGASTSGGDVMLVLPDDKEKICLALAMDYTQLDVQQQNLEYVVHAVARPIGVIVTDPLCGIIVEDI